MVHFLSKVHALFFHNPIIAACVIGWISAQLIKVLLVLIQSKKLDFTRLVGSGGMPSSHSSFVVALAVSVGKYQGLSSPLFALAFAFALVVMYDAAGVRRAAGQQAKILNRLMEEHEVLDAKKLKELLGHTPLEVLCGAVLGAVIGLVV